MDDVHMTVPASSTRLERRWCGGCGGVVTVSVEYLTVVSRGRVRLDEPVAASCLEGHDLEPYA